MREREMSTTTTTTTTTTTLPVELIMEILSYLPAKSLLSNCKFVCKSWRILVKDPDFVKMHLNRGAINGGGTTSNSNNNNNSLSLMCRSGKQLFQLHPPFNFEDVPHSHDHTVTITPTKLDVESLPFNSRSRLVASCNGLLLIDRGEFLVLLNPCTRKYKLSPRESPEYLSNYYYNSMPISYGFGCLYDSTSTVGEYKVVRIMRLTSPHPSKSVVSVYVMSTNSWRKVKDIANDIHEMITNTIWFRPGVFLNGALHWMGHITPDIVSFDVKSEEFRIMPRPPFEANLDINVLLIMRGCLCMVRFRKSCVLEISVMKEYGVRESWTQEFVIRLSFGQINLSGLRSVACLDDQILVQEMGGRLVLYDMNKKMSAYTDIHSPNLGVPDEGFGSDMVPCIESLVSLKSSLLPLSKDRKRRKLGGGL